MALLYTVASGNIIHAADINQVVNAVNNNTANVYNIVGYGADPTGVADSTTAIGNAISAANSAGGGVVSCPAGTFLTGTQTLYSNVHLLGAGPAATTLKLNNGVNGDLFQSSVQGYGGGVITNIAAAFQSGSNSGITDWSIRNMTLDGNKANQSGTSIGIHAYTFYGVLENLIVQNFLTNGIYTDWNGTTGDSANNDRMEMYLLNVKVHNVGATGIKWAGPHDSQWTQVIVYGCLTGNGIHIGSRGAGLLAVNCHSYPSCSGVNAVSWLIENSSVDCLNCIGESALDQPQVVILQGRVTWKGGQIYSPTNVAPGLQLGQNSGQTPFFESTFQSGGLSTFQGVSECDIDTTFNNCLNWSLNFAEDAGNNAVRARCYMPSGSYYIGTPSNKTRADITGRGLTPDGTGSKGGLFNLGLSATGAFQITDGTSAYASINTFSASKRWELPNGTILRQYSDSYTTRTVEISGGTISLLQSTSAAATATSGTITTSGVGIARVAPTGNITAVVLQAGTLAGQYVTVRNESTFTVTFDVAGNSHVADGTNITIAAGHSRIFEWDSINSLWRPC